MKDKVKRQQKEGTVTFSHLFRLNKSTPKLAYFLLTML